MHILYPTVLTSAEPRTCWATIFPCYYFVHYTLVGISLGSRNRSSCEPDHALTTVRHYLPAITHRPAPHPPCELPDAFIFQRATIPRAAVQKPPTNGFETYRHS